MQPHPPTSHIHVHTHLYFSFKTKQKRAVKREKKNNIESQHTTTTAAAAAATPTAGKISSCTFLNDCHYLTPDSWLVWGVHQCSLEQSVLVAFVSSGEKGNVNSTRTRDRAARERDRICSGTTIYLQHSVIPGWAISLQALAGPEEPESGN